jgi:hypothetical protein
MNLALPVDAVKLDYAAMTLDDLRAELAREAAIWEASYARRTQILWIIEKREATARLQVDRMSEVERDAVVQEIAKTTTTKAARA